MIPLSWSGQSAGTGVLRTRCIGCWTSPSARMTAACATGRLRATLLSFARSLSTWSPGTGAPKPAYVAGAKKAAWDDGYMFQIIAHQAHAGTLGHRPKTQKFLHSRLHHGLRRDLTCKKPVRELRPSAQRFLHDGSPV